MRNEYPFKYGELKVAAEVLAKMINGMPSIASKNPHVARQAKIVEDLIKEQEERVNEKNVQKCGFFALLSKKSMI